MKHLIRIAALVALATPAVAQELRLPVNSPPVRALCVAVDGSDAFMLDSRASETVIDQATGEKSLVFIDGMTGEERVYPEDGPEYDCKLQWIEDDE